MTTPPAETLPRLTTLLARQIEFHPDRVAVIGADRTLTFAELGRWIEALAQRITQIATPGERVAVHLERGAGYLAAAYAVWRAGCVYVPLDKCWPPDRIAMILHRAEVAAVLLDGPFEDGIAVVRRSTNPLARSTPESAYIVHTSGTTGFPKGVEITHASLSRLVHSHQSRIYGPAGVETGPIAMTASFAFDSAVERLSLAALGYTVHVLDDAIRTSPIEFVRYVCEHRIRAIDAVPSHLRVLLDAGLVADHAALALIIVGGEAISAALWDRLARLPIRVFNVYGPTENTINTTICEISATDEPNIGSLLPTVTAILDIAEHSVNGAAIGELLVGGEQLTLGYINDDDANARAFVEIDGARYYRTGDLVRREGQVFVFLGRTDGQVKINGHRIETAEVQAALERHESVHAAAVITTGARDSRTLLATVVLADTAADTTCAALRSFLEKTLPGYAVPAHWQTLTQLPLTANLKLDAGKLESLWRESRAAGPSAEPAASTTVEVLRRIWEELLDVELSDEDPHFFAAGGESVTAMRSILIIRKRLEVSVELADLIRSPTLRALAALIDQRRTAAVAT